MSITEAQRHDLYETIKDQWGEARAEAMMTLLPPVGWADVATKQDVAYLGSRIDRVDERFDRLDAKVDGMSSRFITWLLTSQATVVAATAAMILLD
jgi:hypothetical protein